VTVLRLFLPLINGVIWYNALQSTTGPVYTAILVTHSAMLSLRVNGGDRVVSCYNHRHWPRHRPLDQAVGHQLHTSHHHLPASLSPPMFVLTSLASCLAFVWMIASAGLGVVLKFLKFWNLSWNVLKLELGREICTYILKFSRVFTSFFKNTHYFTYFTYEWVTQNIKKQRCPRFLH